MKSRLLAMVVFLVIPLAAAQPAPPMNIYGNVTENGTGALGKKVEIRFNGEVIASDSTGRNGFYDLYVPYSSEYANGNVTGFVEGNRFAVIDFRAGESFRRDVSGEYKAPTLSEVAEEETNTSALITWSTDEPSITKIFYGQNTPYRDEVANRDNYTRDHSINVTGLQPGTEYVYKIVTRDSAGNERVFGGEGDYYSFETDGEKPNSTEEQEQASSGQSGGQAGGGGGGKVQNNTDRQSQLGSPGKPQSFPIKVDPGQSAELGFVEPGTRAVVKVAGGTSLTGISFTADDAVSSASISVNHLGSVPTGLPSPGETYTIASLNYSGDKSSISNPRLNFSVGRAWVASLEGTVDDVKAMRFSGGRWRELDTSYRGIVNGRYIFSAYTPGFSYFSVVMETPASVVKVRSVNASNLEGEVPYTVTLQGLLENTADEQMNRTVEVYLGNVPAASEQFTLEPGQKRNFSIDVRITEPGEKEIAVAGTVFEIDARSSGLLSSAGFIILVLLTLFASVTVYARYTGILDLGQIFREGRKKARIEVEDGKFEFKGSENTGEKDVKGRVTLTVGFEDGEPSLKERRIYRRADQHLDYDWSDMIEKNLENVEEGLSQRIREFVKDVKEQNSEGYVCSICMEEFDTEDALHIHQSFSHEIKCSVCGQTFETVRALHIHQGMKHGEISHDLYD
ncbi:MAG: PGF-pre-PGF domain-containing protein [Candidatus Nanosalina sp.]